MLAKVNILLPFAVTMPENESFDVYSYFIENYEIRIYPFLRSEKADLYSDADEIKMDGIPAFNADILQIVFKKDNFTREPDLEFDPPMKLISEVANEFLSRFRYVTGSSQIKLIDTSKTSISVMYTNDEGEELEKEGNSVKGKVAVGIRFLSIGLNKNVWNDIHSVNPFTPIPIWKNLLLDAKGIMPEIGPAIVLTFTALEVFISKILNDISKFKNVDPQLWEWINNRGFNLKNPSLEEQYDFLSKHFIGKSLKENKKLWEAFKNLQSARNSFAHKGIASLGGKEVDEIKAHEFISKTEEIINFVKLNLPSELQWTEYKQMINFESSKTITVGKEQE